MTNILQNVLNVYFSLATFSLLFGYKPKQLASNLSVTAETFSPPSSFQLLPYELAKTQTLS